jgi:hypothetical protein
LKRLVSIKYKLFKSYWVVFNTLNLKITVY